MAKCKRMEIGRYDAVIKTMDNEEINAMITGIDNCGVLEYVDKSDDCFETMDISYIKSITRD